MNYILELRHNITEAIRSAFRPIDVREHPKATFTADDLRKALKDRDRIAIRVGFEGILEDAKEELGSLRFQMTWAAYVCARDGSRDDIPRDKAILRLMPNLISLVRAQPWTVPEEITVGAPKTFRLVAGYQGDADDTASDAVWLLRWKQDAGLEVPTDGGEVIDPDLRPLLEVLTQYDLAPANGTIDAEDRVLLPQTEDEDP